MDEIKVACVCAPVGERESKDESMQERCIFYEDIYEKPIFVRVFIIRNK